MSNQYGLAQIVTDGLVLCLDANNVVSYPGSGATSRKETCIVFGISMDKIQYSFMNPCIGLCCNFGTKVHK